MKNTIYVFVSKILCKKLNKKSIIVMKLFPLEYMILDDIKITPKGEMYLKYIEENGTGEGFEEMYNKMFKH